MQYFEVEPQSAPKQADDNLPTWLVCLGLAVAGATIGWFLGPWAVRLWRTVAAPGDRTAWYLTRSMATVAYIALTGAAVWGLMLSTKLVKSTVPAPLAMALHSALAGLGVVLGGLHALLLLLDQYYSYTIGDLLIPFTGPYRPFWVGLGAVSLYGLTIVSVSFALRRWLGYQAWRRLHYLSFPLFVLVTLHGLFAGTDSANFSTQMMYLCCGSLVLVLTVVRIATAAAPAKASAAGMRAQRDALGS